MYCACGHPSQRYGQNSYAATEVENINLMKLWDILQCFPHRSIPEGNVEKMQMRLMFRRSGSCFPKPRADADGERKSRRAERASGGSTQTHRQTFTAKFRRRRTDRQLQYQEGCCCLKFLPSNVENPKSRPGFTQLFK